jgi:hypothetical protein
MKSPKDLCQGRITFRRGRLPRDTMCESRYRYTCTIGSQEPTFCRTTCVTSRRPCGLTGSKRPCFPSKVLAINQSRRTPPLEASNKCNHRAHVGACLPGTWNARHVEICSMWVSELYRNRFAFPSIRSPSRSQLKPDIYSHSSD